MERMKGKVAIVTGGATGIGRAIALKFLAEKADVIVFDIGEAAPCSTSPEGMSGLSHKCVCVTDSVSVQLAIESVFLQHGKLDVLVNNAGIMFEKLTEETTEEEWDRLMAVNVKGPFLCTKYSLPYMRKSGGGAIVNIGSIEGLASNPKHAAYAASKGAVHAMTRALATDEGVRSNVRCNAVCPGWIDTALNKAYFDQLGNPEQAQQAIADLHPLGRTGTPEDVANMVCWLASDEAGFVTGQEFVVDGGRTARLPLVDFNAMERTEAV